MDRSLEPALVTALLWTLFGASHIGLAHVPIRQRLVDRFGRWGFLAIYYAVAAPSFTLLVTYFARHRLEGAPGPGLAAGGAAPALAAVSLVGMALVAVALLGYPRSAYTSQNATASAPRGIETVTRHPFFVGLALFGVAHALLATRLVASVFMGALAVFVLLGAAFQDRKLRVLRGEPYARYLAQTSTIPFVAMLRGRASLSLGELPWTTLAVGAALAWLLRSVHGGILGHGGLFVSGSVVGGALFFALREYAAERRAGRPVPQRVAS